ncbi:MAG: HEAT repeat domain-containing protein [Oscillatoriales cyanobacterium SM2_1_8]|nr:HEAT repeat domain-containing protein [Oscillatoriales cyanobacterium SM2_1_8]
MKPLSDLVAAIEQAESAKELVTAVENLAAQPQPAAVPILIEVLGYNNPGAAVAAVEGLAALGSVAVPELLTQLDGHNYTARAWAIRALALIGDPRGLLTLLGAATADFATSVRRAAAKGLGFLRWEWFPAEVQAMARQEVLEALLFALQQDEEWVVRYGAIVGLEGLGRAFPEWVEGRSAWRAQLQTSAVADPVPTVRARAHHAHQRLQEMTAPPLPVAASPLNAQDWQTILTNLYQRRAAEREANPTPDWDAVGPLSPPSQD